VAIAEPVQTGCRKPLLAIRLAVGSCTATDECANGRFSFTGDTGSGGVLQRPIAPPLQADNIGPFSDGQFHDGAGVLLLHLALTAGVATAGLMGAVNFVLASAFRWLLAVPALLWAAGTTLHAMHPAHASGPSAGWAVIPFKHRHWSSKFLARNQFRRTQARYTGACPCTAD
jgi:hypothetical protein